MLDRADGARSLGDREATKALAMEARAQLEDVQQEVHDLVANALKAARRGDVHATGDLVDSLYRIFSRPDGTLDPSYWRELHERVADLIDWTGDWRAADKVRSRSSSLMAVHASQWAFDEVDELYKASLSMPSIPSRTREKLTEIAGLARSSRDEASAAESTLTVGDHAVAERDALLASTSGSDSEGLRSNESEAEVGQARTADARSDDPAPGGPLAADLEAEFERSTILAAQDRLAEAGALLGETLTALQGRGLGESPEALRIRIRLASLCRIKGDFEAARWHDQFVFDACLRIRGKGDPMVLEAGNRLRQDLLALEDASAEQELVRELAGSGGAPKGGNASESERKGNGSGRWQQLSALADAALATGNWPAANQLYGEMMDGLPPQDPSPEMDAWQRARMGRARALTQLQDHAGARSMYEDALSSGSFQPGDPRREVARLGLVRALRALGDTAGAKALCEQMLDEQLQELPPEHPSIRGTRAELADISADEGDLLRAVGLRRENVEQLRRTAPPRHPLLERERLELVELLRELGEVALGLEILDADDAPRVVEAGYDEEVLGWIEAAERAQAECRLVEALELRRRALDRLRQTPGRGDEAVLDDLRDVAALLRVLGRVDEARTVEEEIRLARIGRSDAPVRLANEIEAARARLPVEPLAPQPEVLDPVPGPDGTFFIRARVRHVPGILAFHVLQDGVEQDIPLVSNHIATDGMYAELEWALRVPDEELASVVSIGVEDLDLVRSGYRTLVCRQAVR